MGRKARQRPPRKPRKPPRDLSTLPEEWRYEVVALDDGMRLDHYLQKHFPWRSRTVLHAFIAEGRILVRGEPRLKKASRVFTGDAVVVRVPPPPETERHAELAAGLVVLHEDDDLVAIAKPAGMIVHPVGKRRVNTLIQALHWRYRRDLGKQVIPRICHRLDRETSGIVIVALNPKARARLQDVFEERAIEKEYAAICRGVFREDSGRIDLPIGPDPEGKIQTQMAVVPDGLPSATRFRVLERFAEATLVRFDLETGRQHQIRVHARAIGHPVLLDPIYGDDEPRGWPLDSPVIARHALHARRIAFPHPTTGERLEVVAPLPPDMEALVGVLRTSVPLPPRSHP